MPIVFLLANNAFGKMTLKQKQDEEMLCYCQGKDEFKLMPDCDHIITTNPKVIKEEFPTIYHLCKKGAKYRTQTKRAHKTQFYQAIDNFRIFLERKYGNNDNELLS